MHNPIICVCMSMIHEEDRLYFIRGLNQCAVAASYRLMIFNTITPLFEIENPNTDGEDGSYSSTLSLLHPIYDENSTDKRKSIKIHTIGLGSSYDSRLEEIANISHGEFFKAYTADELVDIYTEIGFSGDFDTTDTDGDGLYDAVEAGGIRIQNGTIISGCDPTNKDTDNDGLEDGQEIDPTIRYKNRIWRSPELEQYNRQYYFVMYSNPGKSDSDEDEFNDKEDYYPLSPYSIPHIEKIQDMEKYVEEFWTTDEAMYYQQEGYITYNTNSIITMNIIRNIKYGSGSGDGSDFKWFFTSGDSYALIESYINDKDSSIMEFFKAKENANFTDPYGNKVDYLHLLATLSGQYNTNFVGKLLINKKLSGWAGDLQSLIYNLKVNTYATNKNLREVASLLIAKDDTYFSMEDMISDVDAENIYNLYSDSDYLSYMIEDYYKNNCQTRYYTFVNGYGGIEELEKETNKFTSGNNIVTHSILKEYAQKAANNTTIKEIYEKSFIEYILIPYVDSWGNIYYEYDPIYALPDPKEVTKEESDALTYAFINFIRENMER